MDRVQFNEFTASYLAGIQGRITGKQKQYTKTNEPFAAFESAASDLEVTPETACLGMAIKHWVSIKRLVKMTEAGESVERTEVAEKLGDMTAYLVLLAALFEHRARRDV